MNAEIKSGTRISYTPRIGGPTHTGMVTWAHEDGHEVACDNGRSHYVSPLHYVIEVLPALEVDDDGPIPEESEEDYERDRERREDAMSFMRAGMR